MKQKRLKKKSKQADDKMEATIKKPVEKKNYASFYTVDTILNEKTIDGKFTVRQFEGKDKDGNNCTGVDIIFKNQYVSAVALFSNDTNNKIKNIYDSINDFDGVYRFVYLFGV